MDATGDLTESGSSRRTRRSWPSRGRS